MNLWHGLKCMQQTIFKIKSLQNWHGTQCRPKLNPNCTLKQPTWNLNESEQVITKRSATLKGDLKFNLEPKWFWRRGSCKFHVSDFRATQFFTSYCAHIKKNYSGSRSVGGKSWNQNTSKKRPWLIFRYVLGSVFVAQPSKVSCNRQKTWHGAQLHRGKPQRGNNGGNTTGRPHRENEKCHVYGG